MPSIWNSNLPQGYQREFECSYRIRCTAGLLLTVIFIFVAYEEVRQSPIFEGAAQEHSSSLPGMSDELVDCYFSPDEDFDSEKYLIKDFTRQNSSPDILWKYTDVGYGYSC